jgi:hypothetical protein
VHASEHLFSFQRFGIVPHHGEIAQPGLDALGDRDLADQATKDKLRSGVDPLTGQGVDDVVPGAGLDLIERLWRLGAALPGSIGTIERSASERRGVTRASLPSCRKTRKLAAQLVEMVDDLKLCRALRARTSTSRNKCTLAKEDRPRAVRLERSIFSRYPPASLFGVRTGRTGLGVRVQSGRAPGSA